MSQVRVASTSDIVDGGALRVELDGVGVAIVRIGDGFYAIGDRCSHADVSLSGGEVDADECTLECPKHGSEFDLRTGEPESLPAVRPVPVFQVTVVGDDVMLEAGSTEEDNQ